GFGGGLLLVGRVQVEINAAQGPIIVGLTEDDRHLLVQGNAMAQVRSAILVSLDGFLHQGMERLFTVLRGLIDAYNVFVVSLQGVRDFLFKRLNSHEAKNKSERLGLEREKSRGKSRSKVRPRQWTARAGSN